MRRKNSILMKEDARKSGLHRIGTSGDKVLGRGGTREGRVQG